MENNNDIMEQPQEVTVLGKDLQEDIEEKVANDGSILGKFKDVESLQKAYENLQKEFTKKSQILSSTQKQLEEGRKVEEDTAAFLENTPEAKDYIDVLKNMLYSDKQLLVGGSPLNNAWNKFRQDNFVTKENLAKDEEFLAKYIYSSDTIKQKILEDYFKGIALDSLPPMIAKQVGSKSIVTKNIKPTTFEQAGKVVKSILEK